MPLLHIIDGSGYIFRAYYAIRRLSTAAGEPTNAVYGFTTMFQKAIADEKPRYLALTFDAGKPSFRQKIYPDYKAHRPPPPEDLVPQFQRIFEVAETFAAKTFRIEGWEADDVIATLTRRALAEGFEVCIITGDKDLMQLVNDRVTIFDPMKDKRFGRAEVIERFGVPPERVVDVLALAGDTSDNVPGVKGVGEKTAAKLISTYGDLAGVMKAAANHEITSKIGQTIAASAEAVELSKKLVSLDDQVPLELDLLDLEYRGPNVEAQQAMFEALEFKRLVTKTEDGGARPINADRPIKTEEISAEHYRLVLSEGDLAGVCQEIEAAGRVAFAIVTNSGRLLDAEVFGLALCAEKGKAHYIPLLHQFLGVPKQLELGAVLKALTPIAKNPRIRKIGIEIKAIYELFERAGITMVGLDFDGAIASYLLDPDGGAEGVSHDLRETAARFLGASVTTLDDLLGRGKQKREYPGIPLEEALIFLGTQADIALRAADAGKPLLEEAKLTGLLVDLEMPLVSVLGRLELAGVKVDLSALASMHTVFEGELARLEKACFEAAGSEFNLGSPKQLQKVLYEDLGLRIVKRTKTGPSTDASVLEALSDEHPLPQAILEYRQVQKLKSTYVDALPKMVAPKSGRVHTIMNQAVAATGRLSSTEPNLQNIPIRTELGRQLRKVFIAEPGRKLISVDYSQIELRVLAHMSKDPVLSDAFLRGMDVHTRTAAELFQVDPKDVTPEQRGQAKTVNFGVLYGMGPMRLARQLGIQRRAASKFVEDYFERQPGVKEYIERTLEIARNTGYVTTLLGRRRKVHEIASKNRASRGAAERIAINTPIQGTAADLIKLAMIRVDARLRDQHPETLLILQVHDELLLEAPEKDAEAVAAMVRREMEGVYPLDVPLVAEPHLGRTWAEAH
ncbi:MAG: DNA polymerase I [Myxococcota bacterium]